MRSLGARVHISGTKEALTKSGNIRPKALANLRAATIERSSQSVARYRSEMRAEYNSPWAHGQVGKSIKAKVKNEKDGVSVQFTALGGDRDHIVFLTNMFPGESNFLKAPFTIGPLPDKRVMNIRAPGKVRNFIQDPATGRMGGSKAGVWRRAKKVTVGFNRDVLAEVSQSEGENFVADVYAAVAAAIAQSTG